MGIENYSASASLNTTLGGLNIAEGMTRADVDDAFRQIMADIASGVIPAIQPKKYGATGDGATNDRAAFVATDAVGPFEIPSGDYLISSSLTITNDVRFRPGARLIIPTGVTITFSGQVDAPVRQIFVCSGTGAVVFNWTKTAIGYMEWWGGKADGTTDNLAAWNAATLALLLIKGQGGDYLFSATAKLLYPNRAFHGVMSAKYRSTSNEVTRFLVSGGSANAVQIGPDSYPGSINAFQQGNEFRNVFVHRTVAPIISSNCIGVLAQYTLYCRVENVTSDSHMIGFKPFGNAYIKWRDCQATRSNAGTGAGTDYWRGWFVDGTAAIGAAGGNASLYTYDCSASCNIAGLQTGDSIGLYITSAFSDQWHYSFDTTNCYDGIRVVGSGASGNVATDHNLHFIAPQLDAFHNSGLRIISVAQAGAVNVSDLYCAGGSGARASIWITSSSAAVTLKGGNIPVGGTSVQPIILETSSGIDVDGIIIDEASSTWPVIGIDTCTNLRIRPMIKNRSVTAAVAIQLVNTNSACIFEPIILGKASAFTKGIDVSGTGDARNEYNLTGIDSACIATSSANKLVRNAVQITATGLYGTNLVSGVTT